MTNAQTYSDLLTSNLFDGLSEIERLEFFNACRLEIYQKKTPILVQDTLSEELILVARGSVEISYTNMDGRSVILHHATAGDVLGAVEAVAKRPCAATCTAFPDAHVLICPNPLLRRYLQIPRFIRNLASGFYDALKRDNELKTVDHFYTAEQRICTYLIQLSQHGSHIRQSQAYVANVVGCSRQTVNKEFGYLKERGIISVAKGRIDILDACTLRQRVKELDQS